jgi:hypothetical protein
MNLIQDIQQLKREGGEWVSAGAPLASGATRSERIELCRQCDDLHPDGRCKHCRCFVSAKTWLGTSRCPLNKWKPTVPAPDSFFASEGNAGALLFELRSWLGTRFFPQAAPAVKGVRADCVSFVEAALVNVGAIKPIKWPAYVTRTGGDKMRLLLLSTLNSIPELANVGTDVSASLFGDILVCSSGKALHHLAINGGANTIWHATEDGGGVCQANLTDPVIANHLIAIYRVK